MRFITKRVRVFSIVVGSAIAGLWMFDLLPFPSLFSHAISEQLSSPSQVSEIRDDSLVLDDGRRVRLPFIRRIPRDLPILKDAVKYGVEIDNNGHVFGLVRIHHWCGNDPVRKHVARVDLSNMLISWGADTTVPLPEWLFNKDPHPRYTTFGWDVGQFYEAKHITESLEKQIRAEPSGTPSPHSPSAQGADGLRLSPR